MLFFLFFFFIVLWAPSAFLADIIFV
jgi:hypothetical protein